MLKAVSLYCGAGFADYCLEQAAGRLGIKVEIIAAYDIWDKAVEVYNANLNPVAQVKNVKELDSLPECDFIFGGPPCVGWSKAGKRFKER